MKTRNNLTAGKGKDETKAWKSWQSLWKQRKCHNSLLTASLFLQANYKSRFRSVFVLPFCCDSVCWQPLIHSGKSTTAVKRRKWQQLRAAPLSSLPGSSKHWFQWKGVLGLLKPFLTLFRLLSVLGIFISRWSTAESLLHLTAAFLWGAPGPHWARCKRQIRCTIINTEDLGCSCSQD